MSQEATQLALRAATLPLGRPAADPSAPGSVDNTAGQAQTHAGSITAATSAPQILSSGGGLLAVTPAQRGLLLSSKQAGMSIAVCQGSGVPRVQVKAAAGTVDTTTGSTAGVSGCAQGCARVVPAQHGAPTREQGWAARACRGQPCPLQKWQLPRHGAPSGTYYRRHRGIGA